MAGALRKTMEYLGLAEGEDYASAPHAARGAKDDGFGEPDGEWDAVDDHEDYGHPGGSTRSPRGSDAVHDEDVHAQESEHERRGYGRVTTLHPRSGSLVRPPEVRHEEAEEEVPDLRRITTIHPRTYNEAKSIGESFRGGVPVIMNLTDMSDADAKRLVDFSAGLVFGLRGSIERVTNKVFLLSPEHVTVTGEAAPPRPARLFNQS